MRCRVPQAGLRERRPEDCHAGDHTDYRERNKREPRSGSWRRLVRPRGRHCNHRLGRGPLSVEELGREFRPRVTPRWSLGSS